MGCALVHDVQVHALKQQHNSRLWARVKRAVASRFVESVCQDERPGAAEQHHF